MTLGPKTLAAIAEGRWYEYLDFSGFVKSESEREFARRVALIAAEEERERCATIADELGGVPPEDWQKIGAAIREGR